MLFTMSCSIVLLLTLLASSPRATTSQRFLREGFSNQMESDFRNEAALEDNQALSGMTREMFLMKNLQWQVEPPTTMALQQLANDDDDDDKGLQRHVQNYLRHPIHLKLSKRPGKHGLRAVGTTHDGKKLRAFWRQANLLLGNNNNNNNRLKASDLLEAPYDDAVKSRLFQVEFEIVLPAYQKKQPSIVYQVAVEGGGMNPKAMVPRGGGTIYIYPTRGGGGDKGTLSLPPVLAGSAPVGLRMKPGLVDPHWSRGRTIVRMGRTNGFI